MIREAVFTKTGPHKGVAGAERLVVGAPDLALTASAISRWMVAAVVLLVLASLAEQAAAQLLWPGYQARVFKLAAEANVPTWFQSVTLLGCALAAAATGRLAAARGEGFRHHWSAVASGFGLLSLSETAQVREEIEAILGVLFGRAVVHGFGFVFLAAVAVLAGRSLVRFAGSLDDQARATLLRGCVIYAVGAVVLDVGDTVLADLTSPSTARSVVLATIAIAEEACEMLGAILILRGLLEHLADRVGQVRLGLEP